MKRSSRVALAFVIIGSLIIGVISVYTIRRHWCPALFGSEVWVGNEKVKDANVYCKDDYLIVWSSGSRPRAINVKSKEIGRLNGSDFLKFTLGLFSWDEELHIDMGDRIHPDAANYEEDPKLMITEKYIEYDFGQDRVRVIPPGSWLTSHHR